MQHRKGMPMSRFDDAYNDNLLDETEQLREAEVHDMVVKRKDTEKDDREYDFASIQSSTAYDEARHDGCVVVLPEVNQLLIDIDSPDAEVIYNKNKPKFELHIAVILMEERKTSRNGNTHIYVTLDRNIDASERVLFQSFLGSDQTRELLSFVRILNEDAHPTLFIEKPQQLLLEAAEPQPLLTEGTPIDDVA